MLNLDIHIMGIMDTRQLRSWSDLKRVAEELDDISVSDPHKQLHCTARRCRVDEIGSPVDETTPVRLFDGVHIPTC